MKDALPNPCGFLSVYGDFHFTGRKFVWDKLKRTEVSINIIMTHIINHTTAIPFAQETTAQDLES